MKWSIYTAILSVMLLVTSCQQETSRLKEAETRYEEGLSLRGENQTEAAAECFSQALLVLNQCDAENPEVQRLKAEVEDNLGAMYWKHGLNEEALQLHLDAVTLLRELDEPALLMKALRNCGRVTAAIQGPQSAQSYYEASLELATTVHDTAFIHELQMEMSHDLYLEGGDYDKAIQMATEALDGGAEPYFCHLVLGLANYYLENDSLAIAHLTEATHSPKTSLSMSAYQGLYLIYVYLGDYQKALAYHERFNEAMSQTDQAFRSEEMQRIKGEYDLQLQKQQLHAEQRLRNLYLYLVLGVLAVALAIVLLLLRQKTLNAKLKSEEMKNQMESALKKNKVYVTALALTEQITASTLDFELKEEDWDEFVELIDRVYEGFTQRLAAQYPNLTKGDLQICCLTKQGFSNQVISILMNLQTNSYARRKSRIKQEKMNGLDNEKSFEEFINEI